MEVIVTKLAFWAGARVHPGQKLDVPKGTKGSWFEEPKAKKAKADEPKDDAQQAEDLV